MLEPFMRGGGDDGGLGEGAGVNSLKQTYVDGEGGYMLNGQG